MARSSLALRSPKRQSALHSVLTEGQRAGYVYMHQNRNQKVQIEAVTYHFSTCKRTLQEFVVANGWETEESYALKIQALGQTAAAQKHKSLLNIEKRQTKALKNQAPAFADLEHRAFNRTHIPRR